MEDKSIQETFSKNLKKLLNERDKTQLELAKSIGVSNTTINNYVMGYNMPRMDKVDKICSFFGIKRSDLISEPQPFLDLIPLQKTKKIPILGYTYCGAFSWSEENFQGYFIADNLIKADYCLIAKGDSMIEADIYDGDIVFLKHTSTVENGKIAIVKIDDEVTLKKVIKTKDRVILEPYNKKYQPIILEDEPKARIVGEMVGVYHKIN